MEIRVKPADYQIIGQAVAELDVQGQISAQTSDQLRQRQIEPEAIEEMWLD